MSLSIPTQASSRTLASTTRYPWVPEVASKFVRLPAIGTNLTFQLLGSHRGRYGSGPVLCAWYDIQGTPRALVLPTSLTRPFLKRTTGLSVSPDVVFAVSLQSRSWSTSRRWKGEPWSASTLHINNPDPEWQWTDGIAFAHSTYDTLPGIEKLRGELWTERDNDVPDSY